MFTCSYIKLKNFLYFHEEFKQFHYNDMQYFEEKLKEKFNFYDDLDDIRKFVLIDMAFNLGLNGFSLFHKFLHLLSLKLFAQAAIEMLNSRWAFQVPNRAKVLSEMIKSGDWPT